MPAAGTGLAGRLGFKRRDDPAAYSKAWANENREKQRAYARTYHERHKTEPEYNKMKCDAAKHTRRKTKYGVTKEQYAAMLTAQGGRCSICHEYKGEDLRVDHDHADGAVRDLLCSNCNAGLGFFAEDPQRLTEAIEYLKRHMNKKR